VSYSDLVREADFMNSQIELFARDQAVADGYDPSEDERIADCMCGD
jgi:hypothetical protein